MIICTLPLSIVMLFVKIILEAKDYNKKCLIVNNYSFPTEVHKCFEMGLNQSISLVSHISLYILTFECYIFQFHKLKIPPVMLTLLTMLPPLTVLHCFHCFSSFGTKGLLCRPIHIIWLSEFMGFWAKTMSGVYGWISHRLLRLTEHLRCWKVDNIHTVQCALHSTHIHYY